MKTVFAAVSATALSVSWGANCMAQQVPANYPANYADIIENSKQESKLLIYSNIAADRWEKVVTTFNDRYPWVKVETLDMNSGEVFQRFLAEESAKQTTADLIVNVGPASWINLSEKGLIEPYQSPEASAYPASMKPLPGVYTVMGDPLIFIWNKAILPAEAVPTSFADLAAKAQANPDIYRGRIATYPADRSTFGYSGHFAFAKHHGEKAWEWYGTLAPLSRTETSSGPMIEKLTVGEYSLLYLAGSASGWAAVADPARAQLLGWSYISDGTPINGRPAAIPKGAAHANSAKLMLDFLLSIDGQKSLAGADRMVVRPDLSAKDVNGGHTYAAVEEAVGKQNALMIDYDKDQVEQHDAFIARWKSIFK
ncbi:ABC transporter substrate-binding protein [Ensifer sp. YR511]|uniref:ABC transporter substrate-binding protein n=1 Tax=Ensifer sp. YR511 TaxID=1855294 RepID=UPI00088E8843|nr:ABC transporter substrate-binding protein [Ensifer sp. YR511]SDO04910.1 iron(III) transport system substrate-binding protein [Ensifer sp. YR511]